MIPHLTVAYVGPPNADAELWIGDDVPIVKTVAPDRLRSGGLTEDAAWSTITHASAVFVAWSPGAALTLSAISTRLQGLPVPLAVVGVDDDRERAEALAYGADRCFSRPVLPALLDAVVLAHARSVGLQARRPERPEWIAVDRYGTGRLDVDWVDRIASVDGCPLPLGRQQFQALAFLAARLGLHETRDLVRAVWGEDAQPSPDTVHKLVSTLKRALATAGIPGAVENERGVGYRLNRSAFGKPADEPQAGS